MPFWQYSAPLFFVELSEDCSLQHADEQVQAPPLLPLDELAPLLLPDEEETEPLEALGPLELPEELETPFPLELVTIPPLLLPELEPAPLLLEDPEELLP